MWFRLRHVLKHVNQHDKKFLIKSSIAKHYIRIESNICLMMCDELLLNIVHYLYAYNTQTAHSLFCLYILYSSSSIDERYIWHLAKWFHNSSQPSKRVMKRHSFKRMARFIWICCKNRNQIHNPRRKQGMNIEHRQQK